MRKIILLAIFIIAMLLCITNKMVAQGNGQNNSNGLWQAKGQDTVTTNREVLIKKNLKVQNTVIADSIIARRIKVGNHSIVLGGNPQSGTNDIYTDNGDLFLQSSGNNFNTVINYNDDGFVLIGDDAPNTSDKLQVLGNISVNNEALNTYSYCIDGNPVLNYRGKAGNEQSQISTTNIFVGVEAGANNVVFTNYGMHNTFVGYQAGYSNINTNRNTFTGFHAGFSNKANGNTYFGAEAGCTNVSGNGNTFIGNLAGYSFAGNGGIGDLIDANTFVGESSGRNTTTGEHNTFVGWQSGLGNTSGYDNTAIGWSAGESITTGFRNTFLGENADAGGFAINNSTAIGHCSFVTANNCIILGHIPGVNGMPAGSARIKVGIGTTAPINTLEINSGITALTPASSTSPTRSGLKLTNLTANSGIDFQANSTNTVLSVNNTGDVILVEGGGGGNANICPGPDDNFLTRYIQADDWLCNSLIYSNDENVGIGQFISGTTEG